jgi:hypothetical protein
MSDYLSLARKGLTRKTRDKVEYLAQLELDKIYSSVISQAVNHGYIYHALYRKSWQEESEYASIIKFISSDLIKNGFKVSIIHAKKGVDCILCVSWIDSSGKK